MKKLVVIAATLGVFALLSGSLTATSAENEIKLPEPTYEGKVSVEAALFKKKSARSFSNKPLTQTEVSQILWSANGIIPRDAVTSATSKVTVSAGGLYPLEVFLVCGDNTVEGVPAGVYQYIPQKNSLKAIAKGDKRIAMATAAHMQGFLAQAPATVVIGAEFARTTFKYGGRGIQYAIMEAGSSNQNIYLQAEGLGLRVRGVGAFKDEEVAKVLQLPQSVKPIMLVGIGK